MNVEFPRLTFGLIVLNGEPFVRYNLRALYPFANQIIVVEGAAPGAAQIASPDGHSTDGTLQVLREFKACEDPENKVQIVTAEDEGHPDGFWPGEKHEQSQSYARRARGDYLWQVDIDEFYKPENMQYVLEILRDDPSITSVSFKQITFWGGFDYITDGLYLRHGAAIYRRLFKWGPDYSYVSHRPPTVHNSQGIDVNTIRHIKGEDLARRGIFLYHYSLLFPKQVLDKTNYYSQATWASHARKAITWAHSNYFRLDKPFRVHNVYQYPSWLEYYRGEHPLAIDLLRQDISSGNISVQVREVNDIDRLLQLPRYRIARLALKLIVLLRLFLIDVKKRSKSIIDDTRKSKSETANNSTS